MTSEHTSGFPVSFSICLLRADDIGTYRELQRVFADAFDEPETYLGKAPSDAYVRRWLMSDQHLALVALHDKIVVGGLTAFVLQKHEQERTEVYIYDLAVAEEFRRRGVATALIRELQVLARARDAWVIFVQADYGDEPAIQLYESLGVREEVLHFDIPV